MQVTPFGLQPLDSSWLQAPGDAGPMPRAVAAADQGAFAVGDVVMETGASIDGVAVVTSALVHAVGADWPKLNAMPLVVVAVAPAAPSLTFASPALPAGPKGSNGLVWVVAAGNREFLIAGDAVAPARAELPGAGNPPLAVLEQSINDGLLFARLRYGAPAAGVSGITLLDGASFTDSSAIALNVPGGLGQLHVLGLFNGSRLGPGALFKVRFRSLA